MTRDHNSRSPEPFRFDLCPMPADPRLAFVDRACFHVRNGRFGSPVTSLLLANVDTPRPPIRTAVCEGLEFLRPSHIRPELKDECHHHGSVNHIAADERGFAVSTRLSGQIPGISGYRYLGLSTAESQISASGNSPPPRASPPHLGATPPSP